MRVLVISQYFPPDITAAAFRIGETIELLRARGHAVKVVTARPHRAHASDAPAPAVEDGIIRTPILSLGNGGKLRYLLHYTSFMVNSLVAAALRGGPADVVWATSPPLFVAVSGWAVARLKRVPFVLDIRDIWPDSAVVAGQISRSGRLFAWAKRVEHWLYRHADAITCVARPMAEYIQSCAPGAAVAVVYNGVPSELLDPSGAASGRTAEDGPPTVTYLGNFGYCQELDLLLRAAKQLRDEGGPRMRFKLVGSGAERDKLSRFVEQEKLADVEIHGPVTKSGALDIARSSSALFVQLKDDGTMDKTIPSKVFDYMVTGKPVVYGLQGEARQILERSQGNLYFEPGSLPDLVRTLKRLAADLPDLTARAQANSDIVSESFTRERVVDRLVQVFQDVASAAEEPQPRQEPDLRS